MKQMESHFQNFSWSILVILLLLVGTNKAQTQSMSIQAIGGSANNNVSTFSMEGGEVRFGSGQVSFRESASALTAFRDVDVSPDYALLAALKQGAGGSGSRTLILHPSGDTLSAYDAVNLSAGDPSVGVYVSSNGRVLVRDNIANFNFYNPMGMHIANVSGSSESKGGETISEVAADPAWKTVVLYVPKIKRGDAVGSQVQVLNKQNRLHSIFNSGQRSIKAAEVTDNGQFVMLLTEQSGTDNRIHIMDRFGNDLNTITSDEPLSGARLSDDGAWITAYSQSRVLVLNALTGERLGSTSLRSPIVEAAYFPEDEVILAMTGDYSEGTGIVNNTEFHAIDLGQRKVQRQEYGAALGLNEAVDFGFVRNGRHDYRLTGTSRTLRIRVSL